MKTTIDIPNNDLQEVLQHTGAKTKKDAVIIAIKDFNRRRRLSELSMSLGTFEDFMSQDDLTKMREDN